MLIDSESNAQAPALEYLRHRFENEAPKVKTRTCAVMLLSGGRSRDH